MVRLAGPGNTIEDLVDKGLADRLNAYYNPQSFSCVVFLSL
jgi:hypothetical protein